MTMDGFISTVLPLKSYYMGCLNHNLDTGNSAQCWAGNSVAKHGGYYLRFRLYHSSLPPYNVRSQQETTGTHHSRYSV